MRVNSFSEDPVAVLDPDTPEGKEGLNDVQHQFKLDAYSWLPFAAETYNLSKDPEEFVVTCTPLTVADLPNRNSIAFPLKELTKFQPPPIARMVYKTWAGCPVHIEHDNEDYTKAVGIVLDTSLRPIKGFNGNKIWKVMALTAISKLKDPNIAKKVLNKEITTYSMGADASYFTCSYCNRKMEKYNHCNHLHPEQPYDWDYVNDPDGSKHLVFRNAHDINGIEFSVVEDPAWVIANGDVLSDSLI